LNYNTLQYTIADPRYAVSHSGGYSGTAIAVSMAVPRYAVDYYTDDIW